MLIIARRISDGAIGTDMESSALFAFGIDRKTSVVSISVLSDEIHNSEGGLQRTFRQGYLVWQSTAKND